MTAGETFPKDLKEIRSRAYDALQAKYAAQADNWTHVAGGCETGATWRRSLEAYDGLGFAMKAIHGVLREEVDLSVELLGSKWDLPIGIAPMSGVIGSVCENAFLEMAAGAKAAGIPASIGYTAPPDMHGKMVRTGAAVFRVVKPLRDIDKLKEALKSGQDAGCLAVGVDTDSVAGLKRGDHTMLEDTCGTLSPAVLRELRDAVDVPFMIKGVLSVEDALSAAEIGADAIVVSTHSGSSLDYCPSSLEALPAIVKAVDGRIKVLFDSGIRRGSDIVKAMALGADAVLLGRTAIWGLAMGGAKGLEWLVTLMAEEIRRTMVLLGAQKLADLDRSALVPLNRLGERILAEP